MTQSVANDDFQSCINPGPDQQAVDLSQYTCSLYKNKERKDARLMSIWNLMDDQTFQELLHYEKQLPAELFRLQILRKNIQYMIFIFKRVISNDIEKFLIWFKQELEINSRFRHVYLQVCVGGFAWVIEQWSVASQESAVTQDEVFNKIEMKFEQSMLILEDQDPKQIVQDLFEVKVFNVYKKLVKTIG